MIFMIETVCILAGTIPLVAGYFRSDFPVVAAGCLAFGLIWLFSEWRRWVWMAPVALVIFIIAAGMGVWIGLSPYLMALSVLGTLLAWDLADFSQRLRGAAEEDELRILRKNHLVLLVSLAAISLVLMGAALLIHIRISFGWLFLLSMAVVLGIMNLVKRLRRSGE
jgi:hypothetical protein